MKRIWLILGWMAAMFAPCAAQDYEALWDEVNTAMANDLPKTADGVLRKIRAKALAEGNDAQLMKSTLVAGVCGYTVAPDSGRVAAERMELALQGETRPVAKALWHTALGLVYDRGFGRHLRPYGEYNQLADAHFAAALADPDALGRATVMAWLPLMERGADSRYYNDDLLSVVAQAVLNRPRTTRDEQRATAHRLAAYYALRGNREATLLATLDSIKYLPDHAAKSAPNARWAALIATAETFHDLPLNIETCIALTECPAPGNERQADSLQLLIARRALTAYGKEKRAAALRNFISRKECPSVGLSNDFQLFYPGQEVRMPVTARNVREVELRVTRLALTAKEYRRLGNNEKLLMKKKTGAAQVYRQRLTPAPAYATVEGSLTLSFASPGLYLCELMLEGKSAAQQVVHVSAVRLLQQSQPDKSVRAVAVDALSGKWLKDARLVVCDDGFLQVKSYEPQPGGAFVLEKEKNRSLYAFPVVGDDAYSPAVRVGQGYYSSYNEGPVSHTELRLFTDRAIYRPGQSLQLGGVAYSQKGDEHSVESGKPVTVMLYDVNNEAIDSLTAVTDEMGNFSGSLSLPPYCLPGNFYLEGRMGGVRCMETVLVEEYKRPTFTAEALPVTTEYALGDTVGVVVETKSFNGVAVGGAKVKWSVQRENRPRWNIVSVVEEQEGLTDADGRFTLRVPLTAETAEGSEYVRHHYVYRIKFTATAENGETAEGTTSLFASPYPIFYETDWPSSMCKERLPRVNISRFNVARHNQGGEVAYEILAGDSRVAEGKAQSGESFVPRLLNALPSGEYRFRILSAEEEKAMPAAGIPFTLYSERDTRPQGDQVLWYYVRSNDAGDSTFVMVGSPRRDVTLFYDLSTATGEVERRCIQFSDSLLHFRLAYRPEYGDGARARFVFVKDGELQSLMADVCKPKPDKRLQLRWNTFRSRLTPGQQEEWRLTVLHPDGTPARASVMARLYDASLDALASNAWNAPDLYFRRSLPASSSHLTALRWFNLSAERQLRLGKVTPLAFTQFDPDLFRYGVKEATAEMFFQEVQVPAKYRLRGAKAMEYAADAEPDGVAMEATANMKLAGGAAPEAAPRTNFAETAFFHPALRTDSTGAVSILFTLPESLTAWNFSALAHTARMDYGRLDTTAVARKDFVVRPALPRFLRRGDRTELPATLQNLSDRRLAGTVRCTLTDAQTGRVLLALDRPFELAAGASQTLSFPYEALTAAPLLVCRITAETTGFSDGEEHYLPVLSDLVSVTRSLPFSTTAPGMLTLPLDTLLPAAATHRRLTVEMSANPTWYAVSALPALTDGESRNAVEWATRYYALQISSCLSRRHPALRAGVEALTDDNAEGWLSQHFGDAAAETPWLQEAEAEKNRARALKTLFDGRMTAARSRSALDGLLDLQLPDGSWSWYKGMKGNPFITTEVALLLARTERLTGSRDATEALEKAFGWLHSRVAQEVKEIKRLSTKKQEKLLPTELQLRYLYLRALMGKKPDETADFLLKKVEKMPHQLTMYGKAVTAVALADAGRETAARRQVQSLLEHTVATPEMGRWFDTDRAVRSWRSYRIPTQAAAIEALSRLGRPEVVDEMRLWLLQSKRTQMWETSRATADALFALLAVPSEGGRVAAPDSVPPLRFTLESADGIVGFNAPSEAQHAATTGYVRQSYDGAQADEIWKNPAKATLSVYKTSEGLAWGSVTAGYTLPAAEVKTEGSGLALTRRFEVKRGGEWQPLSADVQIEKGDRLRQVFTLTADGDYDFVELKASRPACLECVAPLSGYVWNGGLPCYRVVRDASNEYFFERVAKGTHIFSEEYFADRAGRYETGISALRSVYAPEFSATAAPLKLEVK